MHSAGNARMKSQSESEEFNKYQSGGRHSPPHNHGHYDNRHSHGKRVFRLEEILNQKAKRSVSSYNKNAIALKHIYPALK